MLATVDLKDASDNIAWKHVQQVFPGWVLHLLGNVRSTRFLDPRSCIEHTMHIYAGMGNATTFVVETLFFAAYVRALAWAHNLPRFVSVFGDDVVCHSEVARLLVTETLPGLVMNAAKSFWGDDALREACGIFAYNGEDVTPIRCDGWGSSYEGCLAVAELYKRLRDSSFLGHTLLAESIAAEQMLPNWPLEVEGYPSISTTLVPYDVEPQYRVHRDWQRGEYKVPVREPKYRIFRADNGWEHKSRFPAAVWLPAWFTGKLCTRYSCRRHITEVLFPTGKYQWKFRWLAAQNSRAAKF